MYYNKILAFDCVMAEEIFWVHLRSSCTGFHSPAERHMFFATAFDTVLGVVCELQRMDIASHSATTVKESMQSLFIGDHAHKKIIILDYDILRPNNVITSDILPLLRKRDCPFQVEFCTSKEFLEKQSHVEGTLVILSTPHADIDQDLLRASADSGFDVFNPFDFKCLSGDKILERLSMSLMMNKDCLPEWELYSFPSNSDKKQLKISLKQLAKDIFEKFSKQSPLPTKLYIKQPRLMLGQGVYPVKLNVKSIEKALKQMSKNTEFDPRNSAFFHVESGVDPRWKSDGKSYNTCDRAYFWGDRVAFAKRRLASTKIFNVHEADSKIVDLDVSADGVTEQPALSSGLISGISSFMEMAKGFRFDKLLIHLLTDSKKPIFRKYALSYIKVNLDGLMSKRFLDQLRPVLSKLLLNTTISDEERYDIRCIQSYDYFASPRFGLKPPVLDESVKLQPDNMRSGFLQMEESWVTYARLCKYQESSSST